MCMQVKMHELEQDMEQLTSSKLGKESDKTADYHSVYMKYMQSILLKMPHWV